MNQQPRRIFLASAMLGMALASSHLLAQTFPAKPISIVVPYAAGGSTDVSARSLAEGMSKALGVSVVVENKPSAGGFVAATYVAKAPRDGYTLLYSNGTMTATNPNLYNNMPYKVSDFAPISGTVKFPYVINAAATIPVKNIAEMITYAKSKPEGVTIGTVGLGTQTHIVAEWLSRVLGFKVVPVHYKGTSQSSIDLIGGRLDFIIDGLSTAAPMHNAGKLRIIASMGKEHPAILPAGVQTTEEAGHPDLFSYADFGLMAPVGTPQATIRQLHAAVVAALKSPAMVEKMQARGEVPTASASPEEYSAFIQSEQVRWANIIKPMNVKLD